MNELNEAVCTIKSLEKGICTGFIEIGRVLYDVRQNLLFKPKYTSFSGFIEGEHFSFSLMHALNFIKVFEAVKSILINPEQKVTLEQLGLTRILTLVNQGEALTPERIEQAKNQSVSEIRGNKAVKPSIPVMLASVKAFRQEINKIEKLSPEFRQELVRLKEVIEKKLA